MTHHSDQQQHDRSGEQYGQQPGETGTGTRTGTGMDHQPQFGGSSRQSEPGGQGTDAGRSTDSQQRGSQQYTGQRGAQQRTRREGGRSTAERGGGSMRGRHPGGQRMSGQQLSSRQPEMGGATQSTTRGMRSTRARGMQSSRERQSTGAMQPTQGTQGGSQATPAPFFEDHMTDELWIALEDFGELSHVAAWCATRCASGGPELGRCARICQDIAEIAALNELLIARDSMFGPEIADAFLRVAAEGLPTLRRFQQRHPHVLETVATIERTMNACESLLQQVDGGSRGRQGSGTRADQSREMQGTREQGQYGQGMGVQPRDGSEMTGQRY